MLVNAGTKGNGEAHDMCLILNFFGTGSQNYYLRSCKIRWCKLMLRLGKEYLPNEKKKILIDLI